jgi:hypothetical protein
MPPIEVVPRSHNNYTEEVLVLVGPILAGSSRYKLGGKLALQLSRDERVA